jgi:hypothetical protein
VSDDDLLTSDELSEFEAQLDARFKAVAARFVLADQRFITVGERLDRITAELQELERLSETRCKAIERRIEATRAQTDYVRIQIATGIDETRRAVAQVVLLGLLGAVVCTGLLCGLVILLVI